MKKLLIASALLALFAAPVGAVETEDQSKKATCAWARQIDTFKIIDDKTVILQQSPSKRYLATLSNRCHDLRFSMRIAVDSFSSCLRRGDALIVRSPGSIATRCYIDDIVLLPKKERSDADE
jgi:hypothetical protein